MTDWAGDLFMANAKADICLHALGFIRVSLDGDQELRIWHPDLPRAQGYSNAQIHSTTYGFKVLVLRGSFMQDIYALDEDADNTNLRIWVDHISCDIVAAGMTYQISAGTLHSIIPLDEGYAAAIMTRMTDGDKMSILAAPGIDTGSKDFDPYQMPAEELWAIVCKVLGGT